MKKLFLILMMLFSTVNAQESADPYPQVSIEEEVAIGAATGGGIIFLGSLASAFLLEIPEVTMPVVVGGVALGATLMITGGIGALIASAVQSDIQKFNEETGTTKYQ